MRINIIQQTLFGQEQWRVMRDDGQRFMDAHQVDFDTEEDAVACVRNELRRTKQDATVSVKYKNGDVGMDLYTAEV